MQDGGEPVCQILGNYPRGYAGTAGASPLPGCGGISGYAQTGQKGRGGGRGSMDGMGISRPRSLVTLHL